MCLRPLAILAGLGRPGASFEARINHSAADPSVSDLEALRALFRNAGIELHWELIRAEKDQTTWGARLAPHGGQILRLSGSIGTDRPIGSPDRTARE